MGAITTRIGVGLAVAGAVLVGVGVTGLLRSTGNGGPTVPVESGTPTRAEVETPAVFLADLGTAFRRNDVDWLVRRLHPAVLARYGEDRCRTTVATFADATAQFTVVSVGSLGEYRWE